MITSNSYFHAVYTLVPDQFYSQFQLIHTEFSFLNLYIIESSFNMYPGKKQHIINGFRKTVYFATKRSTHNAHAFLVGRMIPSYCNKEKDSSLHNLLHFLKLFCRSMLEILCYQFSHVFRFNTFII